MSTAIYFPQPIEIEDETGSDLPEPPTRPWRLAARRGLATALLLAIAAAVTIGVVNA